MKKKVIVLVVAIGLFFTLQSSQDRYFEISKNIETFNMLFKELNRFYVDDVDPSELMEVGIDAMLRSLDPYTVYLSGAELDNYRMATTGKYGGIGAQIGLIDGEVTITNPYEGFPAHNAGLRAGDILKEVDGKEIKGYNTEEVSQILRGQPGTSVDVKIERKIANEILDLTITRGDIKIDNVPYFGKIDDKTGYIKLSGFAENAGKEVADALNTLKEEHNISRVILDLRGNGGGLLHEAVNVTNVFIEKGVEIVSTKGKEMDNNKSYKTLNKVTDAEIPLVVLTDGSSASASEIVSGAIQDLDRGVIVGQRTFGKGLVQITRPLPYKSRLKVTTSKYYIPSGRCIQSVDYVNRNLDEKATALPDSLRRNFTTTRGRSVLDGAGIDPDVTTEAEGIGHITRSLIRNNHIFDFATLYWHENETLNQKAANFELPDEAFEAFKTYISDKEYDYTTSTEQKMQQLKEVSQEESYFAAIEETLDALEGKIFEDKANDLKKHEEEIRLILGLEIVSRFEFQKGRIAASLQDDPDIEESLRIFEDESVYDTILAKK